MKETQESTQTLEIEVCHYHDAGHGWYAVKKEVVLALGIANLISIYSYQDSAHAYLEEDCDANHFFEAVKKLGPEKCTLIILPSIYCGDRAKIRELPRWKASMFRVYRSEGGGYDRI